MSAIMGHTRIAQPETTGSMAIADSEAVAEEVAEAVAEAVAEVLLEFIVFFVFFLNLVKNENEIIMWLWLHSFFFSTI